MKTLEAKPFDQIAENRKRENRLFTSTVLGAGASGQNRIGTHALRSHRTVCFVFAAQTLVSLWKLALLVTKDFSSPNDTQSREKIAKTAAFRHRLTGIKSCMVDHGCTPAPKDATNMALFFRFFRSFL